MRIGVNIPGRGEISASTVAESGATVARLVAYPDYDATRYLAALVERGIQPLVVLASESYASDADSALTYYRRLYGDVSGIAWQVDNESDQRGSESSWHQSHAQVNDRLRRARRTLGDHATIVAPGLVSGDPRWVDGLDLSVVNAYACLVPDQRVTATRPTLASMRAYEGDVITIETALGQKVTCTPNHPILTRHGWVAAAEIHEGSEVAIHTRPDAFSTGGPNDIQMPTPISEVFRSLEPSSKRYSMPGTPLDFHGDGSHGDIDVVASNSLLRNAFSHRLQNLFLVQPAISSACLSGESILDPGFLRHMQAKGLRPGHGPALLKGRSFLGALEPAPLGLRSRNGRQVASSEQYVQAAVANADIAGDSDHRFARHVARMERGNVRVWQHAGRRDLSLGPQAVSASLEQTGDHAVVASDTLSDALQSLAGQVAFVQVADVSVRKFSGHVYNLTTDNGMIIADGIITHNCHPYGQRASRGWPHPEWGFGDVLDLLAAYRDHAGDTPLWITEFGLTSRDYDEQFRADYLSRMYGTLAASGLVEVACWFALHDFDGFGLLKADGERMPGWYALRGVTGMPADVAAQPVTQTFSFVLGFGDIASRYPDLVGEPVENEHGGIEGFSQQRTTRGLLTFADLRSGRAFTFYEDETGVRWRYVEDTGEMVAA